MDQDGPPLDDMNSRLAPSARASREQDPIRSLLHAIAAEFDLVQADLERLYDDWFISTAVTDEDLPSDAGEGDHRPDKR